MRSPGGRVSQRLCRSGVWSSHRQRSIRGGNHLAKCKRVGATRPLLDAAQKARGKVRGALPRTPPGDTPGPPARFPSALSFQNGPRPQGSAPENLFNPRKDFPPPRLPRALDRCGPFRRSTVMRESGLLQSGACGGLPLVSPARPKTGDISIGAKRGTFLKRLDTLSKSTCVLHRQVIY